MQNWCWSQNFDSWILFSAIVRVSVIMIVPIIIFAAITIHIWNGIVRSQKKVMVRLITLLEAPWTNHKSVISNCTWAVTCRILLKNQRGVITVRENGWSCGPISGRDARLHLLLEDDLLNTRRSLGIATITSGKHRLLVNTVARLTQIVWSSAFIVVGPQLGLPKILWVSIGGSPVTPIILTCEAQLLLPAAANLRVENLCQLSLTKKLLWDWSKSQVVLCLESWLVRIWDVGAVTDVGQCLNHGIIICRKGLKILTSIQGVVASFSSANSCLNGYKHHPDAYYLNKKASHFIKYGLQDFLLMNY